MGAIRREQFYFKRGDLSMKTIKTNHLETLTTCEVRLKPMTQIKVSFHGIAKGKRKILHHLLNIEDIDGSDMLTPEDFNQYERKAWQLIDEKGYRMSGKTAQLCTYDASYDSVSDIIMVKMLPKQQQTIMR